MNIELKLKLKDVTWLGNIFKESSIISPFTLINQEGFDEEDKNRLIELGVIDKENNIKSKYYHLFETLSKTDGFVETIFKRGSVQAKKIVMTEGNNKISVAYLDDEIIINSPANTEGMVQYIREFTGGSKLTGGDLSLGVNVKEAFVFFTICDLYRKDVFKAYSEEERFVYNGFSKEELLEACNNTRENIQSLAYHIFSLNNGAEKLLVDDIDEIIISLKERELIRDNEGIYAPSGEGLLFAGNFLIIENINEVVVGQVKENKLFRSTFTLLQAGPLDLLYLEKSGDKMIMQCLSADSAIKFIGTVLSEKPNII